MNNDFLDEIMNHIKANLDSYRRFMEAVGNFFEINETFKELRVIHSVKKRIKDTASLREKIVRKIDEGRDITKENVFNEINDIAGVRVLHLYPKQCEIIHKVDHVSRRSKGICSA